MFAQYSQVGVDHGYSASGAIYLHNFLCLVAMCHSDFGEEFYNPFIMESVCLLIPMHSLCECVWGQSVPTDPGCVPMQEDQWAPAHFRREPEALAKCSVLESCVSQTTPHLKAIFCALPFNIWFMLVSCGVSASLGEFYSTMGVTEMEKWQRSQTRVSHVQHCQSSSPGSSASGTGCFMSLRIHSRATSSSETCY